MDKFMGHPFKIRAGVKLDSFLLETQRLSRLHLTTQLESLI